MHSSITCKLIVPSICITHWLNSPTSAHDNSEVIPSHIFNSTNPLSDNEDEKKPIHGCKKTKKSIYSDDDSDDTSSTLKNLVQSVESRHAARAELEAEKLKTEKEALELVKKKEGRMAEERWVSEREHRIQEARATEERNKVKAELTAQAVKEKEQEMRLNEEKLKQNQWNQAMKMLNHQNPIIWAKGEQLAKELGARDGIIVDWRQQHVYQ